MGIYVVSITIMISQTLTHNPANRPNYNHYEEDRQGNMVATENGNNSQICNYLSEISTAENR
jgi:hypothetical protein